MYKRITDMLFFLLLFYEVVQKHGFYINSRGMVLLEPLSIYINIILILLLLIFFFLISDSSLATLKGVLQDGVHKVMSVR